jgi:hypothetical protein
LDVSGSSLSSLNLKKNTNMEFLTAANTTFKKLNLSKNTKLSSLDVSNSKLTSLNLKPLKNLVYISFYGSKIKKLNLKQYSSLTIHYDLKKGQSVSLKKYLGTGYTSAYSSSGLTFNSKKTTVKVSKKAKKNSWYELTLTKGDKRYYIDVSVKK